MGESNKVSNGCLHHPLKHVSRKKWVRKNACFMSKMEDDNASISGARFLRVRPAIFSGRT